MADTASAVALATESKSKNAVVRPEKPDEEAFKKGAAELEKANKAKQEALNAIKAKLDLANPKKSDSPIDARRKDLQSQLASIRKTQAGNKDSRQGVMDKVKRLDEQVKSRIAEQKNAKAKVPFKSVEDIDRQIASLQKEVDSGMMKLVDEKKALNEITQLNRAKKSFGGFDASQKQIDDLRNQIADLKKGLDDPEAKALSEKYNSIQAELNSIKSDQDEVYKNLNSLRDQRTKLQAEQQEAWTAMKAFKDEHYEKKRAYRDYENEAYRIRREKQKKENDEYHAGKRREAAQKRLEEASAPAYQDEIMTAQGLIRYFDPKSSPASAAASGPGEFAKSAERKVNDDAFKGMKVVKKDDEDFMMLGSGKKKGKGGKKAPAAEKEKFNLNIGVLEDLNKVKVDAPSSQADVPRVIEQLKEKIEQWKADQEKKTQENIAKAKKEIEKLEQEALAGEGTTDHAKKPAQKNAGLNGHADAGAELAQEKDAIADAARELAEAKLEDA